MNLSQRKTHQIIWIFLVLLVPVLIVFSVLRTEEPLLTDENFVVSRTEMATKKVYEDDYFSMRLQETPTGNELQVILIKPLKTPSAVVYEISSEGKKERYLGTLDHKGIYTFDLSSSAMYIRIHDGLKETEIIKIAL